MNGLFKPSILPMTDDYQKTMEKIAEKQKTEKKEPIVLKDPAKVIIPKAIKQICLSQRQHHRLAELLWVFLGKILKKKSQKLKKLNPHQKNQRNLKRSQIKRMKLKKQKPPTLKQKRVPKKLVKRAQIHLQKQ